MSKPLNEYKLFQALSEDSGHSINFELDAGQIAPYQFRYWVVDNKLQSDVTILGQSLAMPGDIIEDKFRLAAEMFEGVEGE